MPLFREDEYRRADALIQLGYCNPFSPERIQYEREVLGDAFVDPGDTWHKNGHEEGPRANVDRMFSSTKALADQLRQRLIDGCDVPPAHYTLYQDVVLYFIYNKYKQQYMDFIDRAVPKLGEGPETQHAPPVVGFYEHYQHDIEHYFALPGMMFPSLDEADHLFACFFQLRNAFHHIFDNIIGGSPAASRLRAAVWESIFTCDTRRYRRALYDRMGDITTLITGPSGTGKELVARAIGLSRYVPFDARTKRFDADFPRCFLPVNLSALSPTLIESELFGHAKGAFTGAVKERAGFIEMCPAHGSVFLDEIGDLDPSIQVKLLRVLQTRTFQRIGESADRRFAGKVIAATNRDLTEDMACGRFREDLYYRLCADTIVTPSLREQLEGYPEQLRNLLRFVAQRVAGPAEAEALADEVEAWIHANLGDDYPWPGNVRELEQCVRNLMVRRTYHPPHTKAQGPSEAFLDDIRQGRLTADQVLRQYCTLVYAQTQNYQETGRRLGIDRRTVKNYVDEQLLADLD